MKSGKPHKVPLSDAAVMPCYATPCDSATATGLVFPNQRTGKELTYNAFSGILERNDIDAVPHGFRSSFRELGNGMHGDPVGRLRAGAIAQSGWAGSGSIRTADLLDQRRELMVACNFIG